MLCPKSGIIQEADLPDADPMEQEIAAHTYMVWILQGIQALIQYVNMPLQGTFQVPVSRSRFRILAQDCKPTKSTHKIPEEFLQLIRWNKMKRLALPYNWQQGLVSLPQDTKHQSAEITDYVQQRNHYSSYSLSTDIRNLVLS